MKIKLNGENHNHNGNGSINSLLDELKLNKDHAAIMLNGNIVPQENWKTQMIN